MSPDPSLYFWDDWLFLLLQAATVIFLVIYVWKTWQMAAATRRAAEASERALQESAQTRLDAMAPAILIYFDASRHLSAEIVIENAGSGAACDLTMEFDPPLQSTQPHEADEFFKSNLPLIPPKYQINQMFDAWPSYLESDLPKQYTVRTRYRGLQNGQAYDVVHRLDAEAIRHRLLGERGLNEAAEELEGIREALQRQNSLLASLSRDEQDERVFVSVETGSGLDALRQLVGLWELYRVARDGNRTGLDYRRLVNTMQSDLVRIFRLLPTSGIEGRRRELLVEAGRHFFRRESQIMGETRQWFDRVDQIMTEIAAELQVGKTKTDHFG